MGRWVGGFDCLKTVARIVINGHLQVGLFKLLWWEETIVG